MKLLVPLALALCLVTTAIADTNVSGTINTDTTWTAAASPYLVTGTVTVASPRTLTIEPGVTVKFNTNTGLTINGRLLALGTSAANITFTAAAATPTRGSWQPILLNGGTNPASELTYATISYGGSGSSTGIVRIASGAATLDHVTITESATAGIYSLTAGAVTLTSITVANCTGDGLLAETWSGNLTGLHTITDATFATNGGHGVNLGRAGRASITGTTFTDNTNYAVGAEPGTRLDALTAITASGNGGGAKNAVGYRTGTMNARDETWQASSVLAYVIVGGNVVVGSGRTLTIEPGTTIKFSANTGMTVQGTLLAVGTSTNPITFTAAATAPVRGSWRNIDVNAGTNPASRLEHVTVSYGGSGYLFRVWNGTVVIEHSTFTECAGIGVSSHGTGAVTLTASTISNCNSHGLYIEDVYGNPGPHVITDSTITGNGGYGIYVAQRGRASVTNTAISGNTLGGLTSDTSAIDARYCYWGAPTGPGGSGFGTGNSVNTNVLFEPWFAAAPAGAHRFSTYSITNRTFNPTISTTSNPSFGATAAGDWTVTVLNASSTAVRTFTGTGTTGLVSWDGKDTAGTTQPSANYTYEFASSATLVPMRARTILDTTRQLTLTGFAGTPAYLSPNADGIQDTSLLAGTTTFDDLTWSLAVKNSGGSTVRSVAGTGLVTFTWDGRNDVGTLQPDGAYTAAVSVTAGTATVTGSAPLTLDTTPPAITISSPTPTEVVSNVFLNGSGTWAVTGSLTDTNFQNWILDFGTGTTPATWTNIATGTQPITSSTVGVWQTVALPNTVYTLRVRVWDRAGTLTTTILTPTVGHYSMSHGAWEFNPASGGTLTYTSKIPFTLTQTITIRNEAGVVVRTLVNAQRPAGTYADGWNGRNDANVLVPDGAYSYTATLTDGTQTFTWDKSSEIRPHGAPFDAAEPTYSSTFDPFNNQPLRGTYHLPYSYRTSLQAGAPGHAYGGDCTTLAAQGTVCIGPWKYEAPGTKAYSWWGTNTDGSSLLSKEGLQLIRAFFNFAANVAVVYGTAPSISNERADPALFNPGAASPTLTGPSAGTQAVTFTLATYQSQPAAVTMRVVSQSNLSTLRTITIPSQAAGPVTITWDGRADNGMLIAAGPYTLILTITDALGNVITQHLVTTIRY